MSDENVTESTPDATEPIADAGDSEQSEPTTDQLTEPSTEKEPGEEPVAPNPDEPTAPSPDEPTAPSPDEPSHEATGVGVLDVDDV